MSDDTVPPAALLIRDFVNSYEPQVDGESFDSTDALAQWLASRGLLSNASTIGEDDLAQVVSIREGIRNVLLSHAGHEPDDQAAATRLSAALALNPVQLELSETGYQLVSVRTDPAGLALAGLLDAIRQSTQDHTWPRLKVCARDTCRWAFYDASRNQVRRWCSMAGCGNYVKMRRASATRRGRSTNQLTTNPR